MYAVGIRELKAKLSEYLRKVRSGEIVLVSDRGHVVAELRAPTVREVPDHMLATQGLVSRGALTPAAPHDPAMYEPSLLKKPDGTAAEVLDRVRQDSPASSQPNE